MRSSDTPYKALFQDLGLFEEIVRLIAPALADTLDFDTATSLDKEHLTALARHRVQDKLRRVECRRGQLRNGRPRYLLVLLEFQSTNHRDMAWRMREYLHLVEAILRETGTVRAEGAVPEMLSIVVHNGGRPWRAEASWAGPLTGDAPSERAGMRMYATVDLRVLAQGPDAAGRHLVPGSRLAMLAALESAPAEQLPELLLATFRRYDGADAQALRRGLHLRATAALVRHGLGGLPSLEYFEQMLAERTGTDMTAMLDATLKRWAEAKVGEGMRRGLAEGEARGLAEGEAQGRIALLGRQAAWRFGTDVASEVIALLAGVKDVARLDAAGEWLLASESGEALLARLRPGGGGSGNGASR